MATATDATPHQTIHHHSQLNVFVKRKLFSTTATEVEVHSENGRLLQEIPYHTITKLWGYDGLSAEDSKGDLFRFRYTRVYSSRTGPVFISNTSHIGSSGRKYPPAASNQNESYDLLMKEIISHVARIHPQTRLYTGFRTVVVISLVNIMIGIAFMLFPFFEFQMGTRASVSAWLDDDRWHGPLAGPLRDCVHPQLLAKIDNHRLNYVATMIASPNVRHLRPVHPRPIDLAIIRSMQQKRRKDC